MKSDSNMTDCGLRGRGRQWTEGREIGDDERDGNGSVMKWIEEDDKWMSSWRKRTEVSEEDRIRESDRDLEILNIVSDSFEGKDLRNLEEIGGVVDNKSLDLTDIDLGSESDLPFVKIDSSEAIQTQFEENFNQRIQKILQSSRKLKTSFPKSRQRKILLSQD